MGPRYLPCDALAEAHRGLFGEEQCENRPMNYPTYGAEPHLPAVNDALRAFEVEHLPNDLRPMAQQFRDLALTMAEELPDDSETVRALHKLVESKDCAVRALVFNRPTS